MPGGQCAGGMLEISLKRGVPIDFTAPLSNYIENVYQQDIAIFSDALLGLNELRGVCLSAVSAVETLSKLARYYGQVNRLTTRFPLGDDGIKLNFSWYNFGGRDRKPSTRSCFAYFYSNFA